MNQDKIKKISKALSYWLRHNPKDIDLNVATNGWVSVKELIEKAKHKLMFDFNELKYVVQNNDKKRFSFSDDLCLIKANQGHSIDVELKFEEVIPPDILYHGTPNKNVDSILLNGLNKGDRHHCHLSIDTKTAAIVGARRGEFTILNISSKLMSDDGYKFYISENGVYLVDEVPGKYIFI